MAENVIQKLLAYKAADFSFGGMCEVHRLLEDLQRAMPETLSWIRESDLQPSCFSSEDEGYTGGMFGYLPYLRESSAHPFRGFLDAKNWVRIRIDGALDARAKSETTILLSVGS